jgi:hypothetical protein
MVATYVYLTVANGTRTLVQLGSGGLEGPNVMTAAQAAAAGGEGFTMAAGTTTAFNTDAEITDWEAYR